MTHIVRSRAAFDWDVASPGERDDWLRRHVTWPDGPSGPYTTCPAADYELLLFVRRTWSPGDVSAFADALWRIYEARHAVSLDDGEPAVLFLDALPVLHHRTGDYARAAYLAVRASVPGLPSK